MPGLDLPLSPVILRELWSMGDASLHGMETSSGGRQYGVTHVLTKVLAMSPDRTPGPAHSRIQRPAGRAATDPERSASCVEDGTAGLERHRHHVRRGLRCLHRA